jgi:transcriptional regulator with XRE-family HTH domain
MTHLTYTSLGNLLLQLREMNGLSQSEVGKRVGVKSDFISKLERGERNTTPQIIGKLSEVYGVDTNELLNVYHSEVILQQLDSVEDIKPIFDLVESRKKGDSTFQLPSSITKGCNSILKDRRKYVKGGRYGKVKGLNLYPKKNGKLTKGDRKTLFSKSEYYISYIIEKLYQGVSSEDLVNKNLDHLDPSLTDEENITTWNTFYDRYSDQISEFRIEPTNKQIEQYNKSLGEQESSSDETQLNEYRRVMKSLNKTPKVSNDFG